MARKSRELRLSQATALVEGYEAAHMNDDYRARFMRDVIARLKRNKGLSKRQRAWLDSLIEEGVPMQKGDPALIKRIEAAQAVEGMRPYDVNILDEFLAKIVRGWDLSEKQAKWMDSILVKADEIRKNGPWVPDEDTLALLKDCVALSGGYSVVYWETHGGTAKALRNIKEYFAGEGYLDKWCVEKTLKAFKGKLRELHEKRYLNEQATCWYAHNRGEWSMGICVGAPSVGEHGNIVYPILHANGQLGYHTRHSLAKRNPNKGK